MRTVRSFACEDVERHRFRSLLDETLAVNWRKALAYMGYTWSNELCNHLVFTVVLFYGGHLVFASGSSSSHPLTHQRY